MMPRPIPWWCYVPIVLVVGLCLSGCVRRRMTVRTDPPGAMVYIDDYPVGITPVSTSFTYYGTRKIKLVKDGYETLTIMQPIPTPWYEFPPLDFFSENLLPGELRDRRNLCYHMQKQMVVPNEQLIGRAEQLRAQGRSPLSVAPAGFTPQVPDAFQTPSPVIESIPSPPGQPPYGGEATTQPTFDLPPREPANSSQPPNATPFYAPSSGWASPIGSGT